MYTHEKTQFPRQAFMIVSVAAILVFILWNVPQLEFVLYPFRLFVTFVHEAGHSLMAVLTGGSVESFIVYENGTGVANVAGGNHFFILPAGYLGAAFFGAMLFYLSNTVPQSRVISVVLGGLLILTSLLLRANGIALIVGIVFGLFLIVVGYKANPTINKLLLDILAILTGLNAVLDLIYLTTNSTVALGPVRNDAAAFSGLTLGIPAVFWAFVWALIAIAMMAASVYYAFIRPIRKRSIES
jgi:hypothetical protein